MYSYSEAVALRKANPHKNYCSYDADGKPKADPFSARDRFCSGEPFIVASQPRFELESGATVYTVGSCFARNVEAVLQKSGFRLPVFDEEIDQSIYQAKPHWPHTVLNKYNAHSMALEIRRALGEKLPDDGLLNVGEGKWFDPQMSYTKLASEELVRSTRKKLDTIASKLVSSDVLILTLGLTETWIDDENQIVFNNAITAVAPYLRNRLRLFNARPQQVYDVLGAALTQLHTAAPKLRVVITVSPVPMTQTFLSADVAAANAYSKSTLRCAAQMLHEDLPFVDYFPSYEMVMNSPRPMVWLDDQIHVSTRIIGPIIQEFKNRYVAQ
jgi:hypothetical protein